MLQAQSNHGNLITLTSLTKNEIERYKRDYQFYCPVCNDRVMIRSGSRVIPHFAHYPKSSCPEAKGGEGNYHEEGKLLLYQWLKSQHLHVELEPYLKEIEQRPDILLLIRNKMVAIEYQCSRIPVKDIQRRNRGYKRIGIIPLWVIGANQFKRLGKYHLKIDQFTSHFIHQFSTNTPKRLLYFCPETLQMTIFQDFYFTKGNQAIGQLSFHKLNQMRFTDLFIEDWLSKCNLYQLWTVEKRKFRLNNNKKVYGAGLAWRQWLYQQQTHLEYLPSPIYLPVSAQHLMKTPPWDWQSRLYMGIIEPLPIGNQFLISHALQLLQSHLMSQHFFPLIQSKACPILEYMDLLSQLGIVQQQSKEQYIKLKSIPFNNHIEAALKSDEMMMGELIKKVRDKKRA